MLGKQEGIRQIRSQPLGNSRWGEGDHNQHLQFSLGSAVVGQEQGALGIREDLPEEMPSRFIPEK